MPEPESVLFPPERAAAALSHLTHRAAVEMARMRERTLLSAWVLTDEDKRDRLIRVIPHGEEFRMTAAVDGNRNRAVYRWTSTETVACLLEGQPDNVGVDLVDRLPWKAPPPDSARLGRSWR